MGSFSLSLVTTIAGLAPREADSHSRLASTGEKVEEHTRGVDDLSSQMVDQLVRIDARRSETTWYRPGPRMVERPARRTFHWRQAGSVVIVLSGSNVGLSDGR